MALRISLALASLAPLTATIFGVDVVISPTAMADPYRNAAEAPPAWGTYAKRLKAACETVLQADNPIARRLGRELEKLRPHAKADAQSLRMQVSLWIGSTGSIQRVSFPPSLPNEAASDLRALLTNVPAGAPPADMLQPVHLVLSLAQSK